MEVTKKALIYDPYLDTLGGGERYTLTFAKAIADAGYSVEVAWPYSATIDEASERFSLDFSSLHSNKEAFHTITAGSLLSKYKLTKMFDLIFWVSDGSLPFLFGKKNLVHFQVPFKKVRRVFVKSLFINKFIYNSKFTQSVLEQSLPKSKGMVLYPPVDIDKFKSGQKEKLIIGVGRFDAPLNNKRQDILIEAFKKFHEIEPDYRLVLLGGLLGDENKIDHLKIQAQGLPIEFITNPDFDNLRDHYSRAKFFWHAAGFGVNEYAEPEKVEHFGITTVEAISSGCIPVVIAKGGQLEILSDDGLLCQSIDDLSEKTLKSIQESRKIDLDISQYSLNNFYEKIKQLLNQSN